MMAVLTCDQVSDDRVRALAGGKGRNLCDLTAAGFPVPRWAVLGTDVFDEAVSALGLRPSEAPLTLDERLREAAHAEEAIRKSTLPAEAVDQIQAALCHVGSAWVAVRSSGRREDGSEHSFAGLFESFLNLSGFDQVESAVRMCWASTFSRRVTLYRHALGLSFSDVALAVIFQQFVEPVSSGVMFTANPVTGSTSQMVISGVLGLGEGVVSGTADADYLLVDKNTQLVLDETVVMKSLMVRPKNGGGVLTAAVPLARQNQPAVGPALRERLCDLATHLERHFDGPQDVEWAYDGNTVWILQTRPITTLGQGNAIAAEHLGETVAAGELRIWDNSNIIESFSGVTSALTFTVARQLYGDVYRAYAASLKVPPAQLAQMEAWLPVMLGQFNGHVYYNLLHWYRMVGIAPGYPLNRRVLEVALGLNETVDSKTAKSLRPFVFPSWPARVASRLRTTTTYGIRFFTIDTMVRDFDVRFAEFIIRQGFTDVSRLDGEAAYRHFRKTHLEVADIWGPMLVLDAILLTSVGLLAVLMKVFMPKAPEWLGFAVLNPGPDVVSIEPARALMDIAELINSVPALRAFIDTADPEVAYLGLAEQAGTAIEPEWPQLQREIDRYIDRFGYRCLDELKLEAPDLRENPANLFHLLRVAVAQETQQQKNDAAQQYLDTHLQGPRRRIFDALRGKIQRAATHREHLRFCRAQGFAIIKSLAAVMGRDLERRGILETPKDVFRLRLNELFDVYEGALPGTEAQAIVAKRKILDQRYSRLAAPGRFTTRGSRYTPQELHAVGWRPDVQSEQAPIGAVLTGTPSSPGVVTGRAVVVQKPEDFTNGILVAYRTEPSWAVALPFASALLIERASPLTHVAIIARELGVPTVVQIDGLTDAIRTGMIVSVDGATGRVEVLEDRQSCRN